MYTFNDIAIPISWPDKTAFGDEKWMTLLKKIGIVKNLHFKVGHAAILVIERTSGSIRYYDFGRYLSPRGYGRARSALFDPRLEIATIAHISDNGEIQNINTILEELSEKEKATHGGGRTFFSICNHVSFPKCVAYAEQLVKEGPIRYGAFAKNHNSCSRFVAQILIRGMAPTDKRRQRILYPECGKASPTSNVVNTSTNDTIFCYDQGRLRPWKMNRKHSLLFQFGLLKDNFTSKGAKNLAPDNNLGMTEPPLRPATIPMSAQWVGGIGEGAWFHLEPLPQEKIFYIRKYTAEGELEYQIRTICTQPFQAHLPYRFSPHFMYHTYSILQDGVLYIFDADSQAATKGSNQEHIFHASTGR